MKVSFSSHKKTGLTGENANPLPYGPAKRAFPQIRWLLILAVVASPFILLLGKILLDWLFVTSPGTVWLEKTTVNSLQAGTIEKVFYRRGDTVNEGAVLFKVKRQIPENRREQMALLEAERSAAEGKLPNDNALATARINNVTAEMQLAQQSVDYYQKVCDDTRRLAEQGAATKAEIDAAENKLWEAKASLAARAASSASSAPLAQNSARIGQIDQSLNSLQKISEEYFELKSAQGGKVGSVYVADGQSFAAGEPLAVLLNTEQVHIVTYVDPSDYKKITLGTVATVKILGTERKIKAVVEEPPLLADNVPKGISEKVYPITMRGIQVFLKVMEPLQENEMIDGLPVEVSW